MLSFQSMLASCALDTWRGLSSKQQF